MPTSHGTLTEQLSFVSGGEGAGAGWKAFVTPLHRRYEKGRQNEVCVSDPSHMATIQDILPKLCPNGYSAVIDASKFFHMFRTRQDERKYMGLIHPRTKEHWWHATLPMGSTNSPGASGRFGAAFLRQVIDTNPNFQGVPMDNNLASHFRGLGYDPSIGIGRILIGEDGRPALLVWIRKVNSHPMDWIK